MGTLGVLTSGGDSPGMNAAIRAVVRTALYNHHEVIGIYRGYSGLLESDMRQMGVYSVADILQHGGTFLQTTRNEEFKTDAGQAKAVKILKGSGIDALIVIGGDGSYRGAAKIAAKGAKVICLPGTIDNDIPCTDYTIGYDTALNTIINAVDKIRDTASSHERLFFIEVMGRDAGFLALYSAIASGAEAAIIPERETKVDQLETLVKHGFRKSKNSSIVIVAESEITGGAQGLAERMRSEHPEYDPRVTILGHIQRGGSPTAQDRIIASRMGVAAIDALLEGQRNLMVGIVNDEIVYVPFSKAIKDDKAVDEKMVGVLQMLSI